MPEHDLSAWLRLVLAPGIGPASARRLLAAFGPPDNIHAAGAAALAGVVGAAAARRLIAGPPPEAIAAALAWAAEPGHSIVTLADAAYPAGLLQIPDPPPLLYLNGDPALLARPALAIVGARSASPQGEQNAHAFAAALVDAGWTIASGLALGIDAAAHRGALAPGGGTIAVIGTGADRIYPAANAALAREIAAKGLIVSEFPLGTPPLQHNFPRRNRLIAGLSGGVLVVEAALQSGSLITARLAGELGREVFAIPGSIHSPLSRGCHRLLKDGAKLVESAADVLEELPAAAAAGPSAAFFPAMSAESDISPETAWVLENLGHDPVELDTLVQRTRLTPEALYAILLSLELENRVARLPGGRLQRL